MVDLSDYEWQRHLETVVNFLEKLGAESIPRFYVYNKIDRLSALPAPELLRGASGEHPYATLCSRDERAVMGLKETLLRTVRREQETMELFVPYGATRLMSIIYGRCRVLSSEAKSAGMNLSIQGPPQVIAQIEHMKESTR